MKKLTIILLIAFTFILGSCRLGNLSNIHDSGVKVIGKCCKNISTKMSCTFIEMETKEVQENKTSTSLLPIYTWDSKQMLW